jgi:hypothetical protein
LGIIAGCHQDVACDKLPLVVRCVPRWGSARHAPSS